VVLLVVVAGCGGSTKPTPRTGCKGLRTARHSQSFLVLFGATGRLTQVYVCAHLGAPQKITQGRHGLVSWVYGSSVIAFKGGRVVEGAGFERGSADSTYSLSESLQAPSNAR
jgi:hypothetical protein